MSPPPGDDSDAAPPVSVVIIGGGTAGWMTATAATFKPGIQFVDWGRIGDRYLHAFARFGRDASGVDFHHVWARVVREGLNPGPLESFCLPALMAAADRFVHPSPRPDRIEAGFGYAYQFDATRFASYLRDTQTGNIAHVALGDGREIAGDLFVDCSGFRALLIGDAIDEPFENWSNWLPCDRAVALPCSSAGRLTPYTMAQALTAGWRWRIPLQHRTGNGYVFASAFHDEQSATDALLGRIDGRPLAEPRVLRFKARRRRRGWVGNCVAIGLAGGFLEPLESTSIYLIPAAITPLLEYFPDHDRSPVDRDAFNRTLDLEYGQIRDFLILHYYATERAASPFWDYVRTMPIPESLTERLALFRARGRLERSARGLFLDPSWLAVLIRQGVLPADTAALAGAIAADDLGVSLSRMRHTLNSSAAEMPDHGQYVSGYCGLAA